MTVQSDALFRSFTEDVANFDGPLTEAQWFAALAQRTNLLKKYQDDISPTAEALAIEKFLQSNRRCKQWALQLSTSADEELWGTFKMEVHRLFDNNSVCWSIYDALDAGDLGSGSNLEAPFTDRYSKLFGSNLSCTSVALYKIYKAWAEEYPLTRDAEELRYNGWGSPRIHKASKVHCVPKYRNIARTICVEPTLNMFIQRGIGRLIDSRLSRWGYSPSTQPNTNRVLAREGSTHGNWVTIDLESASDSISLNLCSAILPRWFNQLLVSTRCGSCLIAGESLELHMISSMGNGYTFSLETALFYCMCRAALRMSNLSPELCSVFGDDILIRDGKPDRLIRRLLFLAGFTVNEEKSYSAGPFRESCGQDFYFGLNVRSAYIRRLRSQQDIYSAINRLNEWSSRVAIPLPRTFATLGRLLLQWGRRAVNFVPLHESDSSGIRIPLEFLPVWNLNSNNSLLYSSWEPKTIRLVQVGDSFIVNPTFRRYKKKLARLIINPDGILACHLTGHLRNLSTAIRHDNPPMGWVDKLSPCWSYDPRREFPTQHLDLQSKCFDGLRAKSWRENLVVISGF